MGQEITLYAYSFQGLVVLSSLLGWLEDLEEVGVTGSPLHRVEDHPDLGGLLPIHGGIINGAAQGGKKRVKAKVFFFSIRVHK